MIKLFFFNDTATTEIYTLSLHDALPICDHVVDQDHLELPCVPGRPRRGATCREPALDVAEPGGRAQPRDRKSTRLNSSHANISYAVFCLKKKKKITTFKYHKTYHYVKC